MKILKKEDKITLRIVMWTLVMLLFLLFIVATIQIEEGDNDFLQGNFTEIYITISGLFVFNLNRILKKVLEKD